MAPGEWRFSDSYAKVDRADAPIDIHHALSKAYVSVYELGCDGRACTVLLGYDRLANGNDVPPGPEGKHDLAFTMAAVITTPAMQKMRAEAREWTHRPATDRSERRRTGLGAAAPSGPAVPTVTSLAAEAKAARGGTETQQEEAAKDMLVRWLTVFSKVHELHTVKELSAVFFNPDTGRLRIKGEKTLDTLIQDVAACSARLHGHGSPAGFPVGPPQAAAAAPQ